jgi:hypothetical protein
LIWWFSGIQFIWLESICLENAWADNHIKISVLVGNLWLKKYGNLRLPRLSSSIPIAHFQKNRNYDEMLDWTFFVHDLTFHIYFWFLKAHKFTVMFIVWLIYFIYDHRLQKWTNENIRLCSE